MTATVLSCFGYHSQNAHLLDWTWTTGVRGTWQAIPVRVAGSKGVRMLTISPQWLHHWPATHIHVHYWVLNTFMHHSNGPTDKVKSPQTSTMWSPSSPKTFCLFAVLHWRKPVSPRKTTIPSPFSHSLQCHPADPHMPASTRTLHPP